MSINSHTISDLSELWNLQIISDFSEPQITAILVTAYNSNNTVLYEASSENFLLQPGVFNFQGDGSNAVITKYITNDLELLAASKDIRVKLTLYNPIENIELSQFYENVLLNSNTTDPAITDSTKPNSKREKIKKYFAATGNLELTGVYNTRKDTLFYLPTDYFRTKLHTAISVYDIPFTFDMYVTTEQKYTNQKLNSYSFKFDVQTFKNNMIQKASKKIGAIAKVGNLSELLTDKNALNNFSTESILDSLKNNKILSQDYIAKFKEYKSIDGLKNSFGLGSDIDLKKSIAQLKELTGGFDSTTIDSLKKKYNLKDEFTTEFNELKNDASGLYKNTTGLFSKDSTTNDSSLLSIDTVSLTASQNYFDTLFTDSTHKKFSKIDTLLSKADSAKIKLYKKYNELQTKYETGKDSLIRLANNLDTKQLTNYGDVDALGKKLFGKDSTYRKVDSVTGKLAKVYKQVDINDLTNTSNIANIGSSLFGGDSAYRKVDSVAEKLVNVYKQVDINDLSNTSNISGNISNLADLGSSLLGKDSTAKKADSTIRSLLDMYNKASKLYGNNTDSLLGALKSIDKYSVDDLLSFAKINHNVKEKISNYKIQENAKELSKIKNLNVKDFGSYTSAKDMYAMLDKYNILSKKEMLLNNIRSLDIGTVYPYYSDYTLNGVILQGYNLAYNYKKFYIGAAGGKQLNVFNDSILQGHRLKKNLLFGFVLGYGDKQSNHVHLNYVFGKRQVDADSVLHTTQKLENHVIAPDFRWSFFKNKLTLSGEVPVSLTKNNSIEISNSNKYQIGYASKLKIEIKPFKNNMIQIAGEYADKNYTAYGIPFLLKNYLRASAKVSQKINKYFKFEAGYKVENYFKDEERGTKETRIHSLLSSATFNYKILTVNASYSPGWLLSNNPTHTSTRLTVANLTVNANYKIKKKTTLTSQLGASYNSFFNSELVYSNSGAISIENNILNINKNINVYFVQNVNYNKKYILGVNFSFLNNNIYDTKSNNIIILACNYSHIVNKKIRYFLSAQFVNDLKNSKRYTVQSSLTYSVNRYLELNTKLQYDYLKGIVRENFYNANGFQITSSVVVRF